MPPHALPQAIIPRLGFYGFTASGQIVGFVSRFLGAFMALLPIQREGWLSDNDALRWAVCGKDV
jgi:hypothetical protein